MLKGNDYESIKTVLSNQLDNIIMEVNNVNSPMFLGNIIMQTNTFPKLFPDNPPFIVEASKNVIFEDITYKGTAETILKTGKNKMENDYTNFF